MEQSIEIKTLLDATTKDSGLDEGMTEEDARHKTLLLLAYIASLLEKMSVKTDKGPTTISSINAGL